MTHAPRRRDYKPGTGNPKGVVDSSETLRLWGGLITGYGVGSIWGMFLLGGVLPGFLIGGPIGTLFFYVMLRLWIGAASKAMGSTLMPTGESTKYKRQFSDAEAAAIRGDYTQAVTMYQRYVLELPDDPEPYFRIAKIYRNELQDFEQAAHWYQRMRRESQIDRGRDLMATQELVEIYIHKLKQPRKAIPELARMTERYGDTPPGKAAVAELARLRELLAAERDDDGGSLTGRYYKG